MNDTDTIAYPEFKHEAKELTKYIEALGLFSILLKNGDIVHFTPNHTEDFRNWLRQHKIQNLRDI